MVQRVLKWFSIAVVTVVMVANATPARSEDAATLAKKVEAIAKALEAKRKEIGVPGVAYAIVKDDKVIDQQAFGVRGGVLPVTVNTLFPIASATKPFTAMALLMCMDQGLLSLDDHPRKYIPYFKVADPDADARITIRHLLTHSSGVPRTDLAWAFGFLTREEVIRVVGRAKPTAKLGEKWQYQNNMYVAAGEIVGRVNNTTWERFVTDRLLQPLRMSATLTATATLRDAPDAASGHLGALPIWTDDVTNIAPAGAISSNVGDMAQWVRFLLGRGSFEGKRLISEKAFDEAFRGFIALPWKGAGSYGLGWFLDNIAGYRIVHHGGNLQGFESLVLLIPELNLGLVMLSNVRTSELPNILLDELIKHFVPKKPDRKPPVAGAESLAPPDPPSRPLSYSVLRPRSNSLFQLHMQ